jgi:hypothetical protein
MKMADSSSRKRYIAVLCLTAVAVLVAGVLLRPRESPAPVQSDSDFLQLQLMAQKRDLQRRSLFFQTKAADLVASAQAARAKPAQFLEVLRSSGDIVLLVATDKAGLPIWAATSTVGMTTEDCNGRTLDEIGTTITIPVTLSDATAFDLDDNVAGFVVPCGDRRILTTRKGFQQFMEPTLSELLRTCCGLEVTPSPARPGVDIVNIDAESLLAKTGGRPGDRIVQLNGSAVSTEQDLQVLTTGTPVEILVERGKRNRRVKLTLPGSESGKKGSAE